MAVLSTLLLVLTTIIVAVLTVLHRLLTPAVTTKGTTNIPGPTEGIRWPIVGHALWFWKAKTATDIFEVVIRLASMRDKVMSCYFGSKLVIVVTDAKILEAIISINKCQPKEIEFYDAVNQMSNGVFSKNGKGWSDLRRPLDRLLHPKHMDNFHRVFEEKAKILCTKVGKKCGKGVFDMKNLMEYCTLDIITETLLDVPGTLQIEDSLNVPHLITSGMEAIFRKMSRIEYKINWIYRLSSLSRLQTKMKNKIKPFLKKMVDDCYNSLKERGLNPADPDFVPENFIEVAIKAGIKEMKPEEELVFSFLDLIVAGFDTTSVAASTALLYLAMHPEYQEKAYQEQIEVMKGSLDAPSRDELSRMNYLEMVFNETLRRITPAIARTTSAQFTIDGYIFPEGASLLIMYTQIFNDPKYWERPKDFYPDHFLPENVAKRPRAAFTPFSFGGRSCPGKMFGIISTKLILSMLLRRFQFTTSLKYEEMVYKYMMMIESTKGYPLEATARVTHSNDV